MQLLDIAVIQYKYTYSECMYPAMHVINKSTFLDFMDVSISHRVALHYSHTWKCPRRIALQSYMEVSASHCITVIHGSLCSAFALQDLTRFNKIAIQGTPQMAVDKEAICLSGVYSYYYKCNLPLFYVYPALTRYLSILFMNILTLLACNTLLIICSIH